MKLVIISNKNILSGWLTKLFTGCYAYHCGWVDTENNVIYEMSPHGNNRRRPWPAYTSSEIRLFDVPTVTREMLEYELTHDESAYGYLDYVMFGIRKMFGIQVKDASGKICSEKCNDNLWAGGVTTPFEPEDAPPSPCDLLKWAEGNLNEVS